MMQSLMRIGIAKQNTVLPHYNPSSYSSFFQLNIVMNPTVELIVLVLSFICSRLFDKILNYILYLLALPLFCELHQMTLLGQKLNFL